MHVSSVYRVSSVLPGRRVDCGGRERALAGAATAGRASMVAEVGFIGSIGSLESRDSTDPRTPETQQTHSASGGNDAANLRAVSGEMGVAHSAWRAGRRFPLAPHGGEVPQGLGGRAAQFAQ